LDDCIPDQNVTGQVFVGALIVAMAQTPNRRAIDRFRLHPMYTRVVVFPRALAVGASATSAVAAGGVATSPLHGHAYDISMGGVRYELDEALPTGTCVDVEIELPGATLPIRGTGRVVRVYDREDDPGPRRQALQLESFLSEVDRQRLARLIDDGWYGRPL